MDEDEVDLTEWVPLSRINEQARAEGIGVVEARCNACGAGIIHIEIRKLPGS